MFPLMTLAFVVAHLFRGPLWKRVLLFLSSIPIAILMNSFRIGAIGITVEYWGPKMAEGLLHEFEGWVVFMLSTAALLGIAKGLARFGAPRLSLRDALAAPPAPRVARTGPQRQPLPMAFVGAAVLVAVAAAAQLALPTRVETVPARTALVDFPTRLGEWQGEREPLAEIYADALQLDDYLLTNYHDTNGQQLNFYVAWYDSQRAGRSVHSPRACIPGGGWIIRSFEQIDLEHAGRGAFPVNRVIIELDGHRQAVYYWFRQRGRQMTSEYLVKWYIFWDALTRNRTDGALVRIVVPLPEGASEAEADRRVARFAAQAVPTLASYVPD